jgi:hypothetical protein
MSGPLYSDCGVPGIYLKHPMTVPSRIRPDLIISPHVAVEFWARRLGYPRLRSALSKVLEYLYRVSNPIRRYVISVAD